jgi:exosortase A
VNNGSMPTHAAWPAFARHYLVVLVAGAVMLAILAAFGETTRSMIGIWLSSETFSHAFLVAPISLWLVWQRRAELASTPIRPYWPGLLFVAAAGFLWLFGSLADANVVKHFALVLIIQSAVLAVFGLAVARTLAFPLLFLLFAVPFGEAFVPKLMDWTADFTVLALRLTGVPVYREGNNFVIPSGHWSVVEACSGIRYLIASLMAGTLFAYLMYKSYWRRAVFVVAAILVPILANWLRAYLIVVIGHVSANELATGVDHLIYGWVFFGIVLLGLFWVGAKYREDDETPAIGAGAPSAGDPDRRPLGWAALAAVVVAVVWSPLSMALMAGDAERPRSLPPIQGSHGWEPVGQGPVMAWRPHFSGQRAELSQMFARGSDRVVVTIFYYAAQAQGGELINSGNVLITTNDPHWHEVDRGQVDLRATEARMQMRTATLGGAQGRFDVAWWYWVDGRTTISDVLAKGWLAWSRLMLRSDDSAAVFLFTEPSNRRDGAALLQRFAADMGNQIERALATARGGIQ